MKKKYKFRTIATMEKGYSDSFDDETAVTGKTYMYRIKPIEDNFIEVQRREVKRRNRWVMIMKKLLRQCLSFLLY